jgi:hypothetical protein
MFIVQQASMIHNYCMPFATLFNGLIVPVLLMLSPIMVMVADHCGGWHGVRTVSTPDGQSCKQHLALM